MLARINACQRVRVFVGFLPVRAFTLGTDSSGIQHPSGDAERNLSREMEAWLDARGRASTTFSPFPIRRRTDELRGETDRPTCVYLRRGRAATVDREK